MTSPDQEEPREVEPALLEGLGRIVVHWAGVDALVNEFWTHLMMASRGSAYVVTANVSSATVTDWVRTLMHMRFTNENTLANLTLLLNRVDELRAERNALVHGLWTTHMTDPSTAVVQTVRWTRAEVIKHEVVTVADLNELSNDIMEMLNELSAIGLQLGFIRSKLPPKSA